MGAQELFIKALEEYDYLLSIFMFMLMFSILFLVLESSGLLKKENNDNVGKRLHAALAFGITLMALGHPNLYTWLLVFIPNVLNLVLIVFMFVLAVIAYAGSIDSPIKRFGIYAIIFLVLLRFAYAGFYGEFISIGNLGSILKPLYDFMGVIIILAIFILIVYSLAKA